MYIQTLVRNREKSTIYECIHVHRVNGANEKSSVVARDFRPRDELFPTNIRAHILPDD